MWAAACGMLLWICACGAQGLRYLSHQAWSTEEGLPQSSVHAIVQTRDGYIWAATEGGLARFDGISFRVFGRANEASFSSDDICCLRVDPAGGLLVGTADGWLRRDGSLFTRTSGQAEVVALPGGWSWSAAGVRFAGQAREWRVGQELAGRVQAVLVDREGLAWVGMKNGLVVLSGDGSVKPVAELSGNSVLSVFEDAEGNHWIGTETTGLHILRRLKFRSEAGLADLAVTSVVQTTDGAMWVGTRDDGLRRVKDGRVTQPVAADKLTSAVVFCMAPGEQGGVWVGTPDGLDFVSASGDVRGITSADGLPDDYVRSVAAGSDGSVWVGTRHGLAHLRGGKVERVLASTDGLGGDMVGAMLVTPDGLWVGTSGGLSLIGGEGKIRDFTAKDGLAGEIVTAMTRDAAGRLWVATKGRGLSLFDGQRFLWAGVAMDRDRTVDGVTADGAGALWLRMDRGVRRISEEVLVACAHGGQCAVNGEAGALYGFADGLPTDEVVAGTTSGGWLSRDGEIWFPTRRGVAVADAAHLAVDTVAPPVAVERFSVDDAEVQNAAQVAYGHQRFTMEYAGLSYTAPSEVRYRVRLVGFDKAWVDVGSRRTATYTNLPPGRYQFRVRAVNGDGVWNEAGAELRFVIVPPYWRRWWFLGLMLLCLVAVLVGLYLLRLKRLQTGFDAVLAERNRMAREIHDTLTQDFVGTSLQLDIVTQMLKKGKTELAMEQVARTRRLVSEGLDEARQSIWELRANNSQDSLPTRLTRLVQREAMASVAPKLHVGGAYRVLEPRVEREVLRIAQEALLNVQHHSGATESSVNLHYSDEALLLTIEDNGAGFVMDEAAKKAGHYGLVGMRERAAVIDGEIEIMSQPGHGTKVTLRAPIARGER